MWEDNLGKFKTKRSKSSKPYERPKSILRRVTDSVTGLLPQPSWLANWLQSSDPKENDTDSDEEAEPTPSTSSSSEHNIPVRETSRDSFIFQRPPYSLKEHGSATVGQVTSSCGQSTSNSLPSASVSGFSKEISIQTMNGEDDSQSESTSGCSSLLPHPEHRKESRETELKNTAEPLNISQASLQALGQTLGKSVMAEEKAIRSRKTLSLQGFSHDTSVGVSLPEGNPAQKDIGNTSLFSDEGATVLCQSGTKRELLPQPSAFSSKKPRFNITSFGPLLPGDNKSLLNKSISDSPFYAGRTTYGGASAYRRVKLQTPSPYQDTRKRVQVRPSSVYSAPSTVNGSKSGGASNVLLSSRAQDVLKALESMSTPVRDAKKIPVASNKSVNLQDEEPSFTGFGLSRRRPQLGPPVTKLPVATSVSILSRPTPLITTTTTANPVLATSTPISSQAGGKMRTRLAAPPRESSRAAAENEQLEAPVLPTVSLPISSLPSFNLLPTSSTVAIPGAPSPFVSQTLTKKTTVPTTVSSIKDTVDVNGISSSIATASTARPTFTFSAPIVTVNPSAVAATNAIAKQPTFSFSSPLVVKATEKVVEVETANSKSVKSETTEAEQTGGIKVAKDLKSDNVMSFLRRNEDQSADKSKTALSSTWECPVCMIRNATEKLQCAACEAAKPGSSKSTPLVSEKSAAPSMSKMSSFEGRFKPPSDSWPCPVCCINNAAKWATCEACGTPKPTKSEVTKPGSFGDAFKPAPGSWNCPECFVSNSSEKNECAACTTKKPGTAAALPQTGFGDKFKLASDMWECTICMVRNKTDVNKCASCETPRPGTQGASVPKPVFKFGINPIEKPTENIATTAVTEAQKTGTETTSVSKPTETTGFKFGILSNSDKKLEEAGGFKFGATKATEKAEGPTVFKFGTVTDDGKKEEGNGFKFGTRIDTNKKVESVGGFKFGAPLTAERKEGVAVVDGIKPVVSSVEKAGKAEESGGFKFGTVLDTSKKTAETTGFGAVDTTKKEEETKGLFRFGSDLDSKKDVTKTNELPSGLFPGVPVIDFAKKGDSMSSEQRLPTSIASFTPPTFSGSLRVSETNVSTSSPSGPIFSFRPINSPPQQKEDNGGGIKAAPELKTGSVMDLLGKSSESNPMSFGLSASAASVPVSTLSTVVATTTSSFSFGSEANKGLFTFGASSIPTTVSQSTKPYSFGAPVAGTEESKTKEQSVEASTKTTTSLFSFGAPPLPTNLAFKPVSSAPTTTVSSTPSFDQPATFAPPFGKSGPAATASVTLPTAPFTFGAASTTAPTVAPTTSITTGFSFGQSSLAAPAPASASAPFSFGSSTTTPSNIFQFGKEAPKPGGFSFGSSSALVTASAPVTTSASSLFTFGTQSVQASQPEASKSLFTFGSTQSGPSAPTIPSLGQGSSPFAFRSTPASTGSVVTTPALFGSLSASSTGSTAPGATGTSTPFVFGSGTTNVQQLNATPSFNFGSTSTTSAPSQSGAGGVFQFGSNSSFPNQPYNLNAPSALGGAPGGFGSQLPPNPFDVSGGTSTPTMSRRIRKAVRRR